MNSVNEGVFTKWVSNEEAVFVVVCEIVSG